MKRTTENIADKHHKSCSRLRCLYSTLIHVLSSDKYSLSILEDSWAASIPRVAARGQDDSAAGAGAGGLLVRPRQPRPPVRAAVRAGAEVTAGHLPLQPGPRGPARSSGAPPPGQHSGCWGLLQRRQTGHECLNI